MFPDPIAVAANAPNPAYNFSVIRSDGYGSERRDAAGLVGLVINHTTGKGKNGDRHYVNIRKTIDATNPYNSLVSPQSASISISVQKPQFGFTDADLANLWTALKDVFESTDVDFDKFLSFQS